MKMWRITKTNPKIFADEKFNDEYRDFYISPNENREEAILRFERLKKKCNKKFRVCDDDGNWYFKGFATTNDDERAFQPLDNLGVAYGCTYIEYWNPDVKKWEVL